MERGSHACEMNQEMAIRIADTRDHGSILDLFTQGAREGLLRNNDTGVDIEHLDEAYFDEDGASCFWVAETGSTVVGMIGVQSTLPNTGEIRRLRVDLEYRRRGYGTRLMETALDFCKTHGYLKVVLDIRVERGPAITLFKKFGFTHTQTRDIDNKILLDFYLDLYGASEA